MPIAHHHSDWKDGFLFLGNELVLDFLNTRPMQNGEMRELLPDVNALVRWFRAAGLLTARQAIKLQKEWTGTSRATKALEALRDFRETLRIDVVAWEEGKAVRRSTLEDLNRLAAQHPMLTRLKATGQQPALEQWFDLQPEGLFAPIVQSAAKLFATLDRAKVRKCAQCVLHFLDTSKKGTRRWCSMQLCGNRSKVAAYAARQQNLRD